MSQTTSTAVNRRRLKPELQHQAVPVPDCSHDALLLAALRLRFS